MDPRMAPGPPKAASPGTCYSEDTQAPPRLSNQNRCFDKSPRHYKCMLTLEMHLSGPQTAVGLSTLKFPLGRMALRGEKKDNIRSFSQS